MDLIHSKEVTAACGCTSCVNLKEPRIHAIYEERLIYFCSRSCKTEFEEDPDAFLDSDHFKIEFNVLDTVDSRRPDNLDQQEIDDIEKERQKLAEDGLLTFIENR